MSIEHIEVLVEEPSAEAALAQLLPKVLGKTSFAIFPHQGKDDLVAKLPSKLRAYGRWLPASYRILVVLDRDQADCLELKRSLDSIAAQAGLATRSKRRKSAFQIINRLAIEELESWFFGDWDAVRLAYPGVPSNIPVHAKFRDPDAITGGTWEAFERILQGAGYFKSGLRKIEAARRIAPYMDPARNLSASFQALRMAVEELAT